MFSIVLNLQITDNVTSGPEPGQVSARIGGKTFSSFQLQSNGIRV